MYNPIHLKADIEFIFKELKKIRKDVIFKVIILKGSGTNPKYDEDSIILRKSIENLIKVKNNSK